MAPTASTVASKGPVVEIDSKSQVLAAFKVLVENNILSAPVYDADKNECVQNYIYTLC